MRQKKTSIIKIIRVKYMKQLSLKIFSVITSIFMLFVLILGAVVTKTGSGEGCGDDWPFCNGEIIPSNPSIETIIEYSHRLTSSTVGLLIIILVIWAWRALPNNKEARFFASAALFFVVLQGLLGAAAVVWSQSASILALHFGFSLLCFASVFLLTLLVFEKDSYLAEATIHSKALRKHIYGIAIYTYVVVYTGAFVRHTKTSLACKTVPHCGNDTFFWTSKYSLIHMGHRFAAILLFIWVLYVLVKVLKDKKELKVVKFSFTLSFLFILAQAISGMLIVVTLLNLAIALLHAVFISIFFGIIAYLCLLALRADKTEK
jgi:heme a synthase